MKRVTISDIHKRLQGLQSVCSANESRTFYVESSSLKTTRVQDIKRLIEKAANSNQDVPFRIYMELFDELSKKASASDIEKMGTFIAENTIQKVRDTKQTQILLKRRLGRINGKLNNRSINDYKDNISNGLPDPVKVKVENAYNEMLEKAVIYSHCDRVIENYNKISKRFNLDLLFVENTRMNGVYDTVIELCNRIDTYSMPNYIKFNTIIETAWYGFESNAINYNKSDIIEASVDYFAFKKDGLKDCKSILESTLFFDKNEDMGNIDIITEEEPEDDGVKETSVKEMIENHFNTSITHNISINESTSFNDIFEKYKQEEMQKDDNTKPENKLRSLVSKLYSNNVDNIVQDTPNFLSWIRSFFIISTAAIPFVGPIIAIIGLIADKFITLHMERDEVEKMSKCFQNEIKTSKNKLKSTSDHDEKERLEKYIKSLEEAKEKIDRYYEDLLTDAEQEEKYNNINLDSDDFDGSDDDYKDLLSDDFDFGFSEFAVINKITESVQEYIDITNENPITGIDMYGITYKLSDDDLITISSIASNYPDVFYKDYIVKGVNDNISDLRNGNIKFESALSKAVRLSILHNARNILETTNPASAPLTVYEARNMIDCIKETYESISIICKVNENESQLLEASITNTLKMASMKLRNAFTKMKDKDKQISQSIDVGMNNFSKNVERSLTNDNRESIIKGSILPSASKILKLGIVNAGLIAIGQPILAVIATLGYLGTSARFKAKERQMLIDEIEIELKMCQKYIDIAESKNDMKALKQLLMIQRDLERQHQRIKYKMKAELGQKYYDAKHVGDD